MSQSKGGLREKKVTFTSDTLVLDTLSLIPGTVQLRSSKGELIDSALYKINYPKSEIVVSRKNLRDSISVSYRTFPFSLSKETKHKDIGLIRPD